MIVSAVEATRTIDCVTPGCPNEAVRGEFCDWCKDNISHRERRRIWQRAEMRRQAIVMAERRGREFVQAQHRRRRIGDGRLRAFASLERLADQADRRGDTLLAHALERACAVIAETLNVKEVA